MEDSETTTVTTTTTPTIETKNKSFDLNIDQLLSADDGEPEATLVVVSSAERRRRPRPTDDKPTTADDGGGSSVFALKSDAELESKINDLKDSVRKLGPKLPDKGKKIIGLLNSALAEQERRQQRRLSCVVQDECKNSGTNGVADVLKREAEPSTFASCFMQKMEGDLKPDSEQNTIKYKGSSKNAFESDIMSLHRCDNRKRKAGGKKTKPALISEKFSTWENNKESHKRQRYGRLNLINSLLPKENQAGSLMDKAGSKTLSSSSSKDDKEEQTVVLVDEEEPELVENKQEVEEQLSRPNEGKIYYPSREDPECLEIFHAELKCLEPGECLTSTIMNFYIRFLRESCSEADRLKQSFYFFNTYFYSKLQEAVARQTRSEAIFTRFRRWWKGVNIFEKAYIFLPINEDNHWSLVIICIPDEEGSKLSVLHLDSLGLHYSRSIFSNIRSLLVNEWEYLKEDGSVDIPIPDSIWKRLSRNIEEKKVEVPRQTNDYDCGLFVLYYMERFIQDAPGRLKRQDISKFDKKWFKSQEASSLRGKIKRILKEKFHEAGQEDNNIWKPVCLPADSAAPKTVCLPADSSTPETVCLPAYFATPKAVCLSADPVIPEMVCLSSDSATPQTVCLAANSATPKTVQCVDSS